MAPGLLQPCASLFGWEVVLAVGLWANRHSSQGKLEFVDGPWTGTVVHVSTREDPDDVIGRGVE